MTAVREPAPAKVNLFLHVTGRRADGYHLLESLVAFCHAGDVVEYTPAEGLSCEVSGAYADAVPQQDNSLLRAARGMGVTGGRFHLHKYLPVGAGLGGGSGDAAAVIRLLVERQRLAKPPAGDVVALGADVPVCLYGRPAWVTGIGECLAPVALPFVSVPVLLVNPGVPVATPEVFRMFREEGAVFAEEIGTMPHVKSVEDWCAWLRGATCNMLEPFAARLCPEVEAVRRELEGMEGCLLARMSGSGATCFGLFADDASCRRAAEAVRQPPSEMRRMQQSPSEMRRSRYWVRATRLVTV